MVLNHLWSRNKTEKKIVKFIFFLFTASILKRCAEAQMIQLRHAKGIVKNRTFTKIENKLFERFEEKVEEICG